MTSTSIAELLETLGVTRSLTRTRTSNDNPYSEANFKTAKYRPDYPARFADPRPGTDMDAPLCALVQRGPGPTAGWPTSNPADLHAGRAPQIVAARQGVLDAAYGAHPERFPRGRPVAAAPPAEAWINKPAIQAKT